VVEDHCGSEMNTTEEYLTIDELAARLKLEPKTVRNKMSAGIFVRGVHYFSPPGMRPRFKWSTTVAWIEADEREKVKATDNGDGIPMARGYNLGE